VGDFLHDDQRLVFVGGLHRSGTTLLARLIADHPDATGLAGTGVPEDEGQHLQDVYPPAKELGGSGRFAHHARAHLTEDSPLVGRENAQRLWDSWRPFWDSDAPWLVEKSPPNLLMGRYLQALFPSASFLFIVRHPVTVTMATRKWRRRTPMPRLMEHWFTAHTTARTDLPALERVHVISYEWLLADPQETLASVAQFLGLPGELDPSAIKPDTSTPYQRQWHELLDAGKRGANRARERFGPLAQTFGYDLDDLDVIPRHPLLDATGTRLK
jgi:hypothetical protein